LYYEEHVMPDTFVMSARQAAELDHAFERNGWTPAEVKQLSGGALLGEFRKVLLGHATIMVQEHVIDCDANPLVPNGWKVEEHQKGGQYKWDATKVSLWLADGQKDGEWLGGNKLRKELKGKPVYNANVLDYLLANPHLIPEEWKGKYVFFWGTVYRSSSGSLYVRCLFWRDGRWDWHYFWLDYGWSDNRPAAVPAR
jgi:hypothetical protein